MYTCYTQLREVTLPSFNQMSINKVTDLDKKIQGNVLKQLCVWSLDGRPTFISLLLFFPLFIMALFISVHLGSLLISK